MGSDDPEGVASRKLQQAAALLPDPNAGYAKAVRLIFSNIFDFFRANGERASRRHRSSRQLPPGGHLIMLLSGSD